MCQAGSFRRDNVVFAILKIKTVEETESICSTATRRNSIYVLFHEASMLIPNEDISLKFCGYVHK
jgi:hypothetical protein